jgi:hypothetical protein
MNLFYIGVDMKTLKIKKFKDFPGTTFTCTNREYKKIKRQQFKELLSSWRTFNSDMIHPPHINNPYALDDFEISLDRLYNNYKTWWRKAQWILKLGY